MTPRAIVFDAYGTLFDVRAVVMQEAHHIDADADNLATLWRQRQLEYTWLLSLMGRYEDFWSVTKAALHSACQQLRIELSANQRDTLLQSYLSAPVFPEVNQALDSLKSFQLAILSNGSPGMLAAAFAPADWPRCFPKSFLSIRCEFTSLRHAPTPLAWNF